MNFWISAFYVYFYSFVGFKQIDYFTKFKILVLFFLSMLVSIRGLIFASKNFGINAYHPDRLMFALAIAVSILVFLSPFASLILLNKQNTIIKMKERVPEKATVFGGLSFLCIVLYMVFTTLTIILPPSYESGTIILSSLSMFLYLLFLSQSYKKEEL
jgi:hypothetical protein